MKNFDVEEPNCRRGRIRADLTIINTNGEMQFANGGNTISNARRARFAARFSARANIQHSQQPAAAPNSLALIVCKVTVRHSSRPEDALLESCERVFQTGCHILYSSLLIHAERRLYPRVGVRRRPWQKEDRRAAVCFGTARTANITPRSPSVARCKRKRGLSVAAKLAELDVSASAK